MMVECSVGSRALLTLRIGAVVVAWVWWALLPSSGWAVALAALPVFITLVWQRTLGPPFVSVAIAVFMVTAVVALWATYDRHATRLIFDHPVGWQKLWGLVLALLFYYALVTIRSAPGLRWAVGLLAGFGAAVAAAFVVTNDWVAQPALWSPITRFGQGLQGLVPGRLPRGVINPNIAGGVIAPLLPLGVGLAVEGRRARQAIWIVLGLVTTAAMVLAMVLATSRGGWLGLVGALSLAALWPLAGWLNRAFDFDPASRIVIFLASVLVLAVVAALTMTAVASLRRLVLAVGPVTNRVSIFSQAALLVRDYPITGSGLGTFPLLHSTYAVMIHVAVLSHAHALPLNVAVEQGLIAADALLLAWAAAAWLGLRALADEGRGRRCPLLAAALLSLAVLVIHGLVDDALYSSRGVLLLWAPAAVVVAAARRSDTRPACPPPNTVTDDNHPSPAPSRSSSIVFRPPYPIALATLVALALFALIGRPVAALWHANMGAVRQTLAELRAYDSRHFSDATLDQVRRQEDLSGAIASFQRALELDPGQVTAHTRLAQIALARRDYDAALQHAQAAWDAGYRDRVTRLVLGDALVAHGHVQEAAQIICGLERARSRLQSQAWAFSQADDWQRTAYAWQTVVALDPDDVGARAAAARAEEKAAQP